MKSVHSLTYARSLIYISFYSLTSRTCIDTVEMIIKKKFIAMVSFCSSIARGGGYSPPIGMSNKMQNGKNTTFLAL